MTGKTTMNTKNNKVCSKNNSPKLAKIYGEQQQKV